MNWDLPSEFKIQFTINSDSSTPTGTQGNTAYLRFNSSSGVYLGKSSSARRNIVLFDESHIVHQIPVSTDVEYTMTYQNGTATLTDGTDTVTNTATLTKLYNVVAFNSSHIYLKELRVKAL